MRRFLIASTALLGACSYNSAVDTTESWVEVTPQQAVAPASYQRVDAFAAPIQRAPEMDRNGCATSVIKEKDILIIGTTHPREVYCVSIAPLRLTTIELPAGVQMTSAQSGMMDFMSLSSADSGGRTTIALQSKCTPLREKDGEPVMSELHRFVDENSLPFCPRWSSDLAIMTTAGPIYFRLNFNESTRTRVVDMRSQPLVGDATPSVPVKTMASQDLYATSLDGAEVPWVPDDAWSDGYQTVIAWHRPMPTMPSMHVGQSGEQTGVPTVINQGRVIAMVYPRRLTEFQLRMDDRKLQFSAGPINANERKSRWERRDP